MADGPTSLDDFTPEQLNALQDIAQARIDDSLSRRDALKALGMVGGGAATGAIGANTLADPAKADASTTDSDGDVGAPNDRVDGFFDGVDATSVNTDAAVIGGQQSDLHWTHITTSTSTTVSISESFDYYRVRYSLTASNSDSWIRVNGDGSGNGNYTYWDESGGQTSSADQMQLHEHSQSLADTVGTVDLIPSRSGRSLAIRHHPGPSWASRLAGFGVAGGTSAHSDVTDIEINAGSLDVLEFISVFGGVEQ